MEKSKHLDMPHLATIPYQVLIHPSLSDAAKLHFGVLVGLCHREGYCWATDEELSHMSGKDDRTIKRWNAELKGADFIKTEVISVPYTDKTKKLRWKKERKIFINNSIAYASSSCQKKSPIVTKMSPSYDSDKNVPSFLNGKSSTLESKEKYTKESSSNIENGTHQVDNENSNIGSQKLSSSESSQAAKKDSRDLIKTNLPDISDCGDTISLKTPVQNTKNVACPDTVNMGFKNQSKENLEDVHANFDDISDLPPGGGATMPIESTQKPRKRRSKLKRLRRHAVKESSTEALKTANRVFYIPDIKLVGYGRSQSYQVVCLKCTTAFFNLECEKGIDDLFCDKCDGKEEDLKQNNTSQENYIGNIVAWEQKTTFDAKFKQRSCYNYRKTYERDEYTCQYCDYSLSSCSEFRPLHIDHLNPWSSGGSNKMDNLVVSCSKCNKILGDKLFNNFSEKRNFIREKIIKRPRKQKSPSVAVKKQKEDYYGNQRILHGKHVKLSKDEFDKLSVVYTVKLVRYVIEEINDWMDAKKKKPYSDYAAAIRNWIRKSVAGRKKYMTESKKKEMELLISMGVWNDYKHLFDDI
jgi:hypothetical protein